MKYKLGIRDAYNTFENAHDDAIQSHWLSKTSKNFGKSGVLNLQKELALPFPNQVVHLMPTLPTNSLII